MDRFICVTCGTQFDESEQPPAECPICTDPRQYVPPDGQQWTTLAELAPEHVNEIRPEGELEGVGVNPKFAIGQRALLVPCDGRLLLWDCVHLLDEAAAAEIQRRGGLAAIAISHPHYYTGMVEWAHRFGCPIHLHADDASWIMRRDAAIRLWEGERLELGEGLTLIRCGGHFSGGTVLHVAERRALLSGDIVQVIPDRRWVSFMYSYPNLIPEHPDTIRRALRLVEPLPFDAIYGAWWGRVVASDAKSALSASAARYLRHIGY